MKFRNALVSMGSLSLVLSIMAAVPSAVAQTAGMAPPFQSFQDVDADKDGKISIDEASSYHNALFVVLDSDKNGSLTHVEVESKRLGPTAFGFYAQEVLDLKQSRFDAWNLNRDNMLSRAEFLAGTLSVFAASDLNGNNNLDKKEFEGRPKP